MTDSRFKSLSIGDRVALEHQFQIQPVRTVTNQFLKVLDGKATSFIHLSDPSGQPLVVAEYRAYQYDYVGGAR